MEILRAYPDLCIVPILTKNNIILNGEEIEFIKAPTSLIELQRFEDKYTSEGLDIDLYYEDQTGDVSVRKKITSFNDYKTALNHITGQGLVIIVEVLAEKTFNNRNWVCKVSMTQNSPNDQVCKICRTPRPPAAVTKKIQD